jgi:hypothetical protein
MMDDTNETRDTDETPTTEDGARHVGTAAFAAFAVILTEAEYDDLATRHTLFRHKGYPQYLAATRARMAAAQRSGRRVLVGPLLPDQYEGFADMLGIPPGTPQALRAYNDFIARVGPHTVRWTGEPLDHLLTAWRDNTDPADAQDRILPLLRRAANRHPDPHQAAAGAIDTAMTLFTALVERAGDGRHLITCTCTAPPPADDDDDDLVYRLPFTRNGPMISFPDNGPEYLLWAMFAITQLTERAVEIRLRSTAAPTAAAPSDETTIIRGWRLTGTTAAPLTQADLLAAASADSQHGRPTGPEHDARYQEAYPLD